MGKKLFVGFGNLVNDNFIRGQIHRTLRLKSRFGGAHLPDETQVLQQWDIESEFIVEKLTNVSPYQILLDFNQFLKDDNSNIENPQNYFFQIS